MSENFPPNIDPQAFSLSAVAVGVALVGDFNTNELNSISNWIFLVAQYLETVSAQQQLIEGRIDNTNININSKQAKSGGSPYTGPRKKSNQNVREEFEFLSQVVQVMQKEIDNLKNRP